MSLLANSNAIESGGYNIDRSLRFRSSASANLSRTPASASSANIWTWSTWIKRGSLGTGQSVFNARDYTNSGNSYPFADISFTSADQLGYNEAYNGSYIGQKVTTQVFRDPSAWYHIVIALDTTLATAADRVKLYVNGNRITSFSTSVDPSGYSSVFSSNKLHFIGAGISAPSGSANAPFDGYLADTYFVSGQALTPSSFGQTDPVTGVWTPKKYTGTYGTNGFYLDFKDNTSATTLAYDKSGNGNNWTPNNISTTAGATYDSMTDVPTLTSATAANYCVLNPLNKTSAWGAATLTNGNLQWSYSTGGQDRVYGTIGMSSGKWYWEVAVTAFNPSPFNGYMEIGVSRATTSSAAQYDGTALCYIGSNDSSVAGYFSNRNASTNTAYAANYTVGDVVGVALDMDSGTLTFYKNGVSQGAAISTINSSYPGTYFPIIWNDGGASSATTHNANFGQRPFSYTPPTGFKALNTFNLPDPTIKKPNQYMDATTWAGNSGSQSVTNSGFQPDFVWIKNRSNAYSHILQDAVRGVGKTLQSNATTAEQNNGVLTSFDASGFSLNNATGDNVGSLVGWQWKKGATPGFDIVTYTGTGNAATTVPHSLGATPAMIITKRRNSTGEWMVKHKSLATNLNLILNQTSATYNTTVGSGGGLADLTSSTTFGFVQGSSNTDNSNANGGTYVAYLFAEIAGFSKFGSYTGNGSADGPFVYCGFRPKYILLKRTDYVAGYGDWYVLDTARNTYNVMNSPLSPNTSGTENANNGAFNTDFTSNGFKLRTTYQDFNNNGTTYIYAAFAENPLKYSLAR